MIGALTGPAEFNPVAVFMKSVRLKGIYVGSRQMFEDLNRAMEVGKVNPVIDRIFDFDEVKDALRYMESGSHFGKVVVRIQ
jgi:NADPH:quinone reductase-like Zn-dependent oxidoreductase